MIGKRNSQQRRAERHLFVASIAATACADRGTGFPPPEQVAAAIDERCRKHGVEQVHVAPTFDAAANDLDVYVVAEDSSSERVVLVIPFDKRRFLTAELLRNGDVTTGNGIIY
jgi:hypothetical protein